MKKTHFLMEGLQELLIDTYREAAVLIMSFSRMCAIENESVTEMIHNHYKPKTV